jgi:ParB-like chromosome segregation protein Spo0J
VTDSPRTDTLTTTIRELLEGSDEREQLITSIRGVLHEFSAGHAHPVDLVIWVPLERVSPNDYNPNKVAAVEMGLLATSIRHDGYTQPVVVIEEDDRPGYYVIVDGFHRYWTMRASEDIRATTGGLLPIVVIDKSLADRMASTVRHNRARGKHSVDGMASMVFKMLEEGMTDAEVCNELGMEPEELLRLKHITGFAKLYEDADYRNAWQTRRQARIRRDYAEQHPGEGFHEDRGQR